MCARQRRLPWGHPQRQRTAESTRKLPLRWNRKAAKLGIRYRVFCSSLADVFEGLADLAPWRADLFRMIEATTHLDWLLLTKRPDRMIELAYQAGWSGAWPDNVWTDCTTEEQEDADMHIHYLLQVPTRTRFLS